MSLQNDLDTVNEKGVALSRIYDLNSWLMENYRDIPFIDNLIYDRNYRITAVISEDYINERTWSYAWAMVLTLLMCIVSGVVLTIAVAGIEKITYYFRGKRINGHNESTGKTEPPEKAELISDTYAGK